VPHPEYRRAQSERGLAWQTTNPESKQRGESESRRVVVVMVVDTEPTKTIKQKTKGRS
jgi:hypothetical protein